jgi:hypothetical protein
MSRFRPPFLTERFFFLTVKLLPKRRHLSERDFAVLARSLDTVRSRQRFLLTAPVIPARACAIVGHAILFPPQSEHCCGDEIGHLHSSRALHTPQWIQVNVLDRLEYSCTVRDARRHFRLVRHGRGVADFNRQSAIGNAWAPPNPRESRRTRKRGVGVVTLCCCRRVPRTAFH